MHVIIAVYANYSPESLGMRIELILVQMTHEARLRRTLTCYTSPATTCQHPHYQVGDQNKN